MRKLIAATAALVVLAGCGSSSDGSQESKPPSGTDLAATCAQVKMSTDEIGGSGSLGVWTAPTYRDYAADLAAIADAAQPEPAELVRALAEQSSSVADAANDGGLDEASSEWSDRYVALQNACAATDSPIRRLT